MNTLLVYVVKFFWRKSAKLMQNLEAEEDSDFSQWYLSKDLLFLCPGKLASYSARHLVEDVTVIPITLHFEACCPD